VNTPTRYASLTLTVLLAGAVMTGCGGDDKKDDAGASARQLACRTFFLGGAGGGDSLVKTLQAVKTEGSYEPTALLAQVKTVRQGAGEAGSVAGLGDDDYELYRAVVAATAAVESELLGVTDTRVLEDASVAAVASTLAAVDQRCG